MIPWPKLRLSLMSHPRTDCVWLWTNSGNPGRTCLPIRKTNQYGQGWSKEGAALADAFNHIHKQPPNPVRM